MRGIGYVEWSAHNFLFSKRGNCAPDFLFCCNLKKKGAFLFCSFLILFFFERVFLVNLFFFWRAPFGLFYNLSIFSDWQGCWSCREYCANQKYIYSTLSLEAKFFTLSCLFVKTKKGAFFCPIKWPFTFFVSVPFFFCGRRVFS